MCEVKEGCEDNQEQKIYSLVNIYTSKNIFDHGMMKLFI